MGKVTKKKQVKIGLTVPQKKKIFLEKFEECGHKQTITDICKANGIIVQHPYKWHGLDEDFRNAWDVLKDGLEKRWKDEVKFIFHMALLQREGYSLPNGMAAAYIFYMKTMGYSDSPGVAAGKGGFSGTEFVEFEIPRPEPYNNEEKEELEPEKELTEVVA